MPHVQYLDSHLSYFDTQPEFCQQQNLFGEPKAVICQQSTWKDLRGDWRGKDLRGDWRGLMTYNPILKLTFGRMHLKESKTIPYWNLAEAEEHAMCPDVLHFIWRWLDLPLKKKRTTKNNIKIEIGQLKMRKSYVKFSNIFKFLYVFKFLYIFWGHFVSCF